MLESNIYNNVSELKRIWQQYSSWTFSGYIWLSSSSNALLLDNVELPHWEDWQGDFIWEINVYNTNKLSLSIRFLGGSWVVNTVNWEHPPADGTEYIIHRYCTKSLKGKKELYFKECWQPQTDPYCLGLKVLQPTWIAFIGFESEEVNNA